MRQEFPPFGAELLDDRELLYLGEVIPGKEHRNIRILKFLLRTNRNMDAGVVFTLFRWRIVGNEGNEFRPNITIVADDNALGRCAKTTHALPLAFQSRKQ